MENKKVVCFHLLNNYTGSPKVLSQVVKGLLIKGYTVEVVTNRSEGFLSNIDGVKYRYVSYNWSKNKFATLLSLLFAQLQFFFITLQIKRKDTLFYVNTLLPFGAAWACKISGRKLLYHVHEKSVTGSLFYRFLQWSYFKCAHKSIFVSNYLRNCYPEVTDCSVILNSLDQDFLYSSSRFLINREVQPSTILLVASGRKYKGIYEFLDLSRYFPGYSFELVMSCTKNEYDDFLSNDIPSNLKVYANQQSLHPFYQRAKLLLNLSIPHQWTETFGLTILEAMAYGIPTIVPPVGGPVELVEDGYNGYLIEATDTKKLYEKVHLLMTNDILYNAFSKNALDKEMILNYDAMINVVVKYLFDKDN